MDEDSQQLGPRRTQRGPHPGGILVVVMAYSRCIHAKPPPIHLHVTRPTSRELGERHLGVEMRQNPQLRN